MKKKLSLVFGCGMCLLALAVLGMTQLRARQRFIRRGWEAGFPTLVNDTAAARLCSNAALEQYSPARLTWALDTLDAGGFAWVRQRFAWADIEPTPGDFRWESWDAIVAGAAARDLRLLAVLDAAPDWAGTPPEPADFAAFAAAFAARYGDTLTYYQIWHNPNLGDSWGGYANAENYAALLSAAATAIRAADPDARIVLGSLAPNQEAGQRNYAEDLFLERLYIAGAQPYFDVVAVQPYGFSTGPDDRRVARDVLNFSRAILVRETLVAHGDGAKVVWASHWGWNSLPAGWPGPASIWGSVDESMQVANTVAALERAEREWPWMGVMCLNGFQPRPATTAQAIPDAEEHWGFALVGPDDAARPIYTALQTWATRPQIATPGVYHGATSLATFVGTWEFGPLGADIGEHGEQRVTFPFRGTGAALTVRRGPYRAFLYVTVDGQPAPSLPRDREGRSYIVLYDPLAAMVTVPLAEDLPDGAHTVEIVAERGWDQWALADWRVSSAPDDGAYRWQMGGMALLGLLGLGLAAVSGRQLDWGELGRRVAAAWGQLHAAFRWMLSLLVSTLYLFATWQTLMGAAAFRRLGEGGEWTTATLAAGLYYLAPWQLVKLLAGALTSVIVCLDPALGLALTMLAVPFYMHPLSLLGKSFALAELLLLPTLAGWILRLARKRQEAGSKRQEARSREASHPLPVSSFQFPVSSFQNLTSKIQNRAFFWPFLAFILLATVSTVFAEQQREAWRELRLVILEPVLLYAALVTLPMTQRERWRVVDAFVASGVLVAVVGLIQYGAAFCRGAAVCDAVARALGETITAEGGIQRLHSVYGSPNNVGLYLGRILPLLIALTLAKGEARRRWFYALALAPVGAALLLSLSRGAIVLGIPAALLVMGLLAGPRWRRLTVVALVVGAVALIPLLRTPRFAGMLNFSQGTTGFRVALWHSSLGMIRDHPWLGVGPDNFLYAYRTRYVLPTAWEEFNLAHPHNVVLDFAARLGVGGLAFLVWLQVCFWRRALPLRRQPDAVSRALILGAMGSMADFLGHGLVDASYFVIDLAFVFCFTLALVVWLENPSET